MTRRQRHRGRGSVTVSLYVEHEDGTEHEYEVECSVSGGYAGDRHEPPSGPEVEIISVRDGLGELGALDADRLLMDRLEEVEEKALELAADRAEADLYEAAERRSEMEREDRLSRREG